MVKFNWVPYKILLQRIFLLGLGGIIAREILRGYLDYNNQVIEYMQSISYQQARESSKQYRMKLMRSKHFCSDELEPSIEHQDSASRDHE